MRKRWLVAFGKGQRASGDRQGGVSFVPAGRCNMPSKKGGPRVLLVSLCDGIAAVMVALARLDCQIVGFAASEFDRACWPSLLTELARGWCVLVGRESSSWGTSARSTGVSRNTYGRLFAVLSTDASLET